MYVATRDGEALGLASADGHSILWSHPVITLFFSRRAAWNAIRRTIRYAQKRKYFWANRRLYGVKTTKPVGA